MTSSSLPRVATAATAMLMVLGVSFVALSEHANGDLLSSHRRLSSTGSSSLRGVERLHASASLDHNTLHLEHVSYSQLRDAVIDEYFASHDDVTNKDRQFEDALKAMKMIEKDGEPVPIDGMDGLYVGSVGTLSC